MTGSTHIGVYGRSYAMVFQMILASDHFSKATGKTVTASVSINGGSFQSVTPVVEIANGFYACTFTLTAAGFWAFYATASGCDDTMIAFDVVGVDLYDTVRAGLSAIPNATAGANGGLPTVDSSGGVKVQSGTGTGQVSLSSGQVTVGTNNDKTNYSISAAGLTAIVNAVWGALTSSYVSAGTFGKKIGDIIADMWGTSIPASYSIGQAGYIVGNTLDQTISSRSSLTVSDVTTGVNNALDAANTELTAIPSTTGSMRSFIKFLFEYFRNKRTITSSTETLFKEDASTSLGTASVSDDGTTVTKGEMN